MVKLWHKPLLASTSPLLANDKMFVAIMSSKGLENIPVDGDSVTKCISWQERCPLNITLSCWGLIKWSFFHQRCKVRDACEYSSVAQMMMPIFTQLKKHGSRVFKGLSKFWVEEHVNSGCNKRIYQISVSLDVVVVVAVAVVLVQIAGTSRGNYWS